MRFKTLSGRARGGGRGGRRVQEPCFLDRFDNHARSAVTGGGEEGRRQRRVHALTQHPKYGGRERFDEHKTSCKRPSCSPPRLSLKKSPATVDNADAVAHRTAGVAAPHKLPTLLDPKVRENLRSTAANSKHDLKKLRGVSTNVSFFCRPLGCRVFFFHHIR